MFWSLIDATLQWGSLMSFKISMNMPMLSVEFKILNSIKKKNKLNQKQKQMQSRSNH